MTDKRKEALSKFNTRLEEVIHEVRIVHPTAPIEGCKVKEYICDDIIDIIREALQQPDYKAMCYKMATRLRDNNEVISQNITHAKKQKLTLSYGWKAINENSVILTEYQAMKGE